MEELYINMGMSLVLSVIKNPDKAAKFKAVLLKVRNAINGAFPND